MVSSANSLTLEDSDSGRPFKSRCNSHGPKIEPCDTSGSTSTSSEDTPFSKTRYFLCKSCAQIQQLVPDAKSAYYWVHIKGKKTEVYCDMDNYGGGWTLVASISSSSNNHLLRAEVNCFNATRCVEFTKTSISCRKLADQDIHEIATHEGTFRVDQVTNGYVGFFQIPAGARMFNSECHTYSCPRIITSHVYPYQWESNCRGIRNGYFIVRQSCYRESKRVLYGYPCHSLGIYRNKAGLLFVK
ncbi:unnamed protein product [Porites lobata]|uniref:Fibrinogen C-terminal domain-containing protein n=1 Tax=Porites lobata TaxID=104759 RepID=A0ABN8NGJ8_9CNID|nr:unnamed protein product [Porites lobata]